MFYPQALELKNSKQRGAKVVLSLSGLCKSPVLMSHCSTSATVHPGLTRLSPSSLMAGKQKRTLKGLGMEGTPVHAEVAGQVTEGPELSPQSLSLGSV